MKADVIGPVKGKLPVPWSSVAISIDLAGGCGSEKTASVEHDYIITT